MSSHPFRNFIQGYTPLSDDDWKLILAVLKRQDYKRNELILHQGEVCKNLFFLESGLLRYFTLNDGVEVTKFFTDAPYTFTSQKSFTDRRPATESIQAIEPCVVWKLSTEDAYKLLTVPAWSDFIRKLIQEVQFYTESLLLDMQTKTAELRYKNMLESTPELVQRIPVKHLASYFGIAPQSLSRIRKQMLRK